MCLPFGLGWKLAKYKHLVLAVYPGILAKRKYGQKYREVLPFAPI